MSTVFISVKMDSTSQVESIFFCVALIFLSLTFPPQAIFDIVIDACPERSRRDEI